MYTRVQKIECQTMGHQDCLVVLQQRQDGDRWSRIEIRHNVYGRTIIEKL